MRIHMYEGWQIPITCRKWVNYLIWVLLLSDTQPTLRYPVDPILAIQDAHQKHRGQLKKPRNSIDPDNRARITWCKEIPEKEGEQEATRRENYRHVKIHRAHFKRQSCQGARINE